MFDRELISAPLFENVSTVQLLFPEFMVVPRIFIPFDEVFHFQIFINIDYLSLIITNN